MQNINNGIKERATLELYQLCKDKKMQKADEKRMKEATRANREEGEEEAMSHENEESGLSLFLSLATKYSRLSDGFPRCSEAHLVKCSAGLTRRNLLCAVGYRKLIIECDRAAESRN